jgi:hypothetical protein
MVTHAGKSGLCFHSGLPDFYWFVIPKPEKNVPNEHKMYYVHGHKIFQMAIKYINIFQYKALKKLPKFGVLV